MRKKFYMAMIVALIVTTAGYNMYSAYRTTKLSDLALANVEAHILRCAYSGELGLPVIVICN